MTRLLGPDTRGQFDPSVKEVVRSSITSIEASLFYGGRKLWYLLTHTGVAVSHLPLMHVEYLLPTSV